MTPSRTQEVASLSTDDAIRRLRTDPASAELVRDAYLGRDVGDSGRRFAESAEFQELRALLGQELTGACVLDVGAGTGIASLAFVSNGARRVIALEPDPSDEVGRGAISRLDPDGRIELLDASGEEIPLPDQSVDIVYARQLLHHARDLPQLVRECARVLRSGGFFVACREHVVADEAELTAFLAAHPVHQLAGGENAFPLAAYRDAIRAAGLELQQVLGPWDSIINAYPAARTSAELAQLPRAALKRRLGVVGGVASRIPGVPRLVRALRRGEPGRLYSFVARKPGVSSVAQQTGDS